eukprot:sb/3464245/
MELKQGTPTVFCDNDGSWPSDLPTCEKKVCPGLTIANSPTILNGIEAGTSVSVTCTDNTFELKGSSSVFCGNDGSWPSSLPTCEKKDWTAVERGVKIPWDLEGTPLQIMTDSKLASDERISVGLFDKESSYMSTVHVLSYQFTDSSSYTECVTRLGGDVVEQIKFYDADTASDYYRAVCPGFTVDGSVQGSWDDTDPGQIVTINCQNNYVRYGSRERTCNSDGQWNIDAPFCKDQLVTWSPVVRKTFIPFDLESTPLQIKTDSTIGNGDRIAVVTFKEDESAMGELFMEFTEPMEYMIRYCMIEDKMDRTKWLPLPAQPPGEMDKIWTIRKTPTDLSIECNGVELLNYQFSDSSYDSCVSTWGGDIVDKIMFGMADKASDSYRAKPVCPGFTVDGSVQGNWSDTDPGQTVTIDCQKKHVLQGSPERTCNSDGEWNVDAPICRKLSNIIVSCKYSRTPIYRDPRGKGFCHVNRGARYIVVKYR